MTDKKISRQALSSSNRKPFFRAALRLWQPPLAIDFDAFLPFKILISRFKEPKSSAEAEIFFALSVRSIWSALLSSGRYKPGDEVILSAINIPHMFDLVKSYGLVPRVADIEVETLLPSLKTLESLRSERTRLVLIAHLFGTWSSLGSIAEWVRSHGLLLVEDCAQCYMGRDFFGSSEAHLSMFSFGMIKRRTSAGGALGFVRDAQLKHELESCVKNWPQQELKKYSKNLLKALAFRIATRPVMFSLLVGFLQLRRRNPETVLRESFRGFPHAKLPDAFHYLPCPALCRALKIVWSSSDRAHWRYRSTFIRNSFSDSVREGKIAGDLAEIHSFWLLGVMFQKPEEAAREARINKVFAIRGLSSLQALDKAAHNAELVLKSIVYFPLPYH